MNGAIIPCDVDSYKDYYSGTNAKITIYRRGKIRIFRVWNCSLNTIASNTPPLDEIDRPPETVDSPAFFTNSGLVGRIRLGSDGGCAGWVIGTYGNGNSIVTSDTSPTFLIFAYTV